MSYTVWDCETTIRTSFKRKANPFDPANYVVMSGYKREKGEVVGDYFGRMGADNGALPEGWFSKLLAGSTLLVGQNIKFDLLYALREEPNHKAWMQWVAGGGNVWDCQLAEYLLEGMAQEHHMLSMDELAPRYGGNLKFDEVKALWAAGVSTEDINPGLLRRYLCGTAEDHGDIGNTELIFLGQLARARAAGQVKSILMNMGSLLCTTEMELNGMAVDYELGLVQAADLAEQIAEVSIELAQHLPPDLPFDFNWGSAQQKSAIIFGGKVKYAKRTPILNEDGSQAYAQMTVKEPIQDEYGGYVRVKSGKNAGELKTRNVTKDDPDKPKSRMEDYFYEFPRMTEPQKRWQGATEGQYSTGAKIIAELANRGIPFLDALSKVSGLTKDLGTYYISDDEKKPGEKKGMLTLVQASGIIHHMLNHTSTVTGRFSSSNPNLQNLPKEGKSVVKSLFVSRFKDGKIGQSDFTALEVYVQALITSCKQLILDLKAGLDMHCVRVSQKEGIPYEEALDLCVTQKLREWNDKRTKAKVFSFQRAFGAGAKKISDETKMPLEEVEELIRAEHERYPENDDFFEDLMKIIKANSTPTQKFFQHPDIPGLSCNPRRSYWRTPDNKLYTWTEGESPEFLAKRGVGTSFTPTEIKNYPVQGTGGEFAKAAMWLAIRYYYKHGNWGGLALLVNQVHDALYNDCDPSVALTATAAMHAALVEASAFMEYWFDWTIPVPVPVATGYGPNMMEEQRMPPEFDALVAQHRASIRELYINNYEPSFEKETINA
jgi:DNA polymerase I-like protein with 3'-5' exonuclease and polymerase domains